MLLKSDYSSSRTSLQGNCFFLLLWFPEISFSLLHENLCTVLNHCIALLIYFKNKNMTVYSSPFQPTTKARSCCTWWKAVTQLYISFFVPELVHILIVVKLFVCRWRTPYCHRQYYSRLCGDFSTKCTICACDGCFHDACTITSVSNMENMGNIEKMKNLEEMLFLAVQDSWLTD